MGKKEFPDQRAKTHNNEGAQHDMTKTNAKQQKQNTTKHQLKLYLGQQL